MSLLDECIDALGEKAIVLPEKEEIMNEFDHSFPITKWGRIDWTKVKRQFTISTVEDLLSFLKAYHIKLDHTVYILWDEGSLPIIQSELGKILEAIDDVTAVSFDTWIFSSSPKFVIEIFHDGEIKIGLK
ncbi:UNVERIFIED_ORG: hypothetical protein ABRZ91_002296 [Heyndrickxia coagulans]